MTLAADMANDYLFFDGVEDVSLGKRNPTVADVTGVKALRRPVTNKTLSGSAMVEPSDAVFHVWTSTLSSNVPAIRDVLVASDGNWRILQVSKESLGTRYRCLCTKEP